MRIEVNRQVHQIKGVVLTGQELREAIGVPDNEVLWGKGHAHPDEVGSQDGCSYKVKLDKAFKPYEGQEFFTMRVEDE